MTTSGPARDQTPELRLLDEVAGNKVVQTYLALADQFTAQLGYTEHGFRHANLVGRIAFNILDRLGHDRHVAELAAIAGHLHDVGNVISRHDHPQTSALIAMPILTELGIPTEDIGADRLVAEGGAAGRRAGRGLRLAYRSPRHSQPLTIQVSRRAEPAYGFAEGRLTVSFNPLPRLGKIAIVRVGAPPGERWVGQLEHAGSFVTIRSHSKASVIGAARAISGNA